MLRLRPLEPEDLQLLYTIENDPALWDAEESDAPYSKYALKHYLAGMQPVQACGELRLAVEETATGRAVGLADITGYSVRDARAEVGVALLRECRGKGYGRAALALLEEMAENRLRVHSLYARVGAGNDISRRLFLSAGYRLVATLPEWHYVGGGYEAVELYQKIF